MGPSQARLLLIGRTVLRVGAFLRLLKTSSGREAPIRLPPRGVRDCLGRFASPLFRPGETGEQVRRLRSSDDFRFAEIVALFEIVDLLRRRSKRDSDRDAEDRVTLQNDGKP